MNYKGWRWGRATWILLLALNDADFPSEFTDYSTASQDDTLNFFQVHFSKLRESDMSYTQLTPVQRPQFIRPLSLPACSSLVLSSHFTEEEELGAERSLAQDHHQQPGCGPSFLKTKRRARRTILLWL